MMNNKKKAETLPLVKNNLLNNDDHIDWSDQELDELVGDPLEHVLEQMRRRPQNVSRVQYYRSMLFFSILCFVLGTIVSYLIMTFVWNPSLRTFPNALKETVVTQKIVHYADIDNIKTFLRFLINQTHVAGTPADKKTADYVYNIWKKQGLHVQMVPYSVFLSYPNKEKSNKISVILNNGTEIYNSNSWEKILHPAGENSYDIYTPFAAYSPSTDESLLGDLVYANYGQFEDFLLLEKKNIPLKNCIAIIRYGKITPAQKVKFAEQFGIKGVIFYPDPADYPVNSSEKISSVFNYLSSLGIFYSSLNLEKGDPLTPFYPSIESAYRIPEKKAKLPKIPVLPINYEDAANILRIIAGENPPEDWKDSSINVEYLIESGYFNNDKKIKLEVNNNNTQVIIYNVVGIIPGLDEPDRFVIVGSHRDSWTDGSTDLNSGTAVLLELSHIFGKLINEGWKPKRSIMFCSWSASLYGLIGSKEWLEENQKNIEEIVAYLDMNMAVERNAKIAIQSTPLMYRVISEAAKKIPNPNPAEVSEGLLSVFSSWLNHSNWNLFNSALPEFEPLDDSSDHASFIFEFGVPSANLKYTFNKKSVCSSKCLTLYDSYTIQNKLADIGFQHHKALIQLWAEVTHQLADSPLIPFEIKDYATVLNYSMLTLKKQLKKLEIIQHDLEEAVNLFQKEANKFYQSRRKINIENFYSVRAFNDKLMRIEKAFINRANLSEDNFFRHIILSPSRYGNKDYHYFSNIRDLIYKYKNSKDSSNQKEIIENIKKNLSQLVFLIKSATLILQEKY